MQEKSEQEEKLEQRAEDGLSWGQQRWAGSRCKVSKPKPTSCLVTLLPPEVYAHVYWALFRHDCQCTDIGGEGSAAYAARCKGAYRNTISIGHKWCSYFSVY